MKWTIVILDKELKEFASGRKWFAHRVYFLMPNFDSNKVVLCRRQLIAHFDRESYRYLIAIRRFSMGVVGKDRVTEWKDGVLGTARSIHEALSELIISYIQIYQKFVKLQVIRWLFSRTAMTRLGQLAEPVSRSSATLVRYSSGRVLGKQTLLI